MKYSEEIVEKPQFLHSLLLNILALITHRAFKSGNLSSRSLSKELDVKFIYKWKIESKLIRSEKLRDLPWELRTWEKVLKTEISASREWIMSFACKCEVFILELCIWAIQTCIFLLTFRVHELLWLCFIGQNKPSPKKNLLDDLVTAVFKMPIHWLTKLYQCTIVSQIQMRTASLGQVVGWAPAGQEFDN